MTNETKMIIITSNEDLIRQFSSNKNTKTHIIELDNDKQISSITQDNNNIIDLAFLAELSKFSSNNDQVYKRELSSPKKNRIKSTKASKKSIDFNCAICGDRAIGFNYDVPSCASCKAFFRRNAHHELEKLKCLTGQGRCSVSHEIHRKCQRCRLERCLSMGMRKDFILTPEEKQRRKQQLEENRNNSIKNTSQIESSSNLASNTNSSSQTFDEIDELLMDLNKDDETLPLFDNFDSNFMEQVALETLPVEDWIAIQCVRSSFLSIFQGDLQLCSKCDLSDHAAAIISWSESANQIGLAIINFFRQIDEFESLHDDDRFILIKYNLFPLFSIFKCFNYKPSNYCFPSEENPDALRARRFLTLCGASIAVRDAFCNLLLSLVQVSEQDATYLSILLTILIFSQGLSLNEDEPPLNDPLAVSRAQFYYTKLLWNYMVDKFGEIQACKNFIQLLNVIFRIQSTSKRGREFFRDQLMTSDTTNRIAPLMQTVLHIS